MLLLFCTRVSTCFLSASFIHKSKIRDTVTDYVREELFKGQLIGSLPKLAASDP